MKHIKKFNESVNNYKVSFDFDDCLDKKSVQKFCKELVDKGVEVWIVTSRPKNPREFFQSGDFQIWSNEDDLYPIAESIGIPRDRIVFTEHDPKAWWFQNNSDFIWHLDDNPKEIKLIHQLTDVIPISVLSSNWINKCKKFLNI